GWRAQYRWVWAAVHGKKPEGYHLHHRDFNSLNDRLDNLQLLIEEEHKALHREKMLGDNNPARRCMTDEWRAHIAQAVRGEKNPHYGKPHTLETQVKMRAAAAQRWSNPQQHALSSERARRWMAAARAMGRRLGREPGERYERCCPVCRQNFVTAREEQIFCSSACCFSPLGRAMSGAKGGETRRGRTFSPEHREKLRLASIAAARPEDKRRAAEASLRSRCLKAARLLLDAGHEVRLDEWDEHREIARALGARHVPSRASFQRFFASDADLQEHAALYNHKVVSVEFDGVEDVYDGTVEPHHNFAIITSQTPSPYAREGFDYSGCFIHNSEYMHLDSSSCNLSSINMLQYLNPDGTFDVESFHHTVDIMILAQDIIVDNASYPTPQITENTRAFRELGLGYANLGALLMSRGLPYDSDEGRAVAGAITALMTGRAYRQSALIAQRMGPFSGYAINREPMLRVIRKHRAAVDHIDAELTEHRLVDAAQTAWDEALRIGERYGYKNSQVSVLAPTGTIAFMMDCDTTGVEPDIALVKYKRLVGGGVMKIVNRTVNAALVRLGYAPDEAAGIVEHIDKTGTIEGAPSLRPEHLPVFDCAFRPENGVRSIHAMGHIRMMGAVQPFISGAISKTVNLPNDATVEDIAQAYVEGWRLGLKALAIYRDGSKRTQPLSTKSSEKPGVESKPIRRRLPDERQAITHKLSIAGHEGYITVGMFEDGTPGEIFLTMSKEGSTVSGLMDAFATAVSLTLQYGVPLEVLVRKFSHMRFEPSGFTGNKQIPMAKSIMDYIFRWLALKFLPPDEQPATVPGLTNGEAAEAESAAPVEAGTVEARERAVFVAQSDAPSCPDCGSLMTRNGSCYRCLNCGSTSGCS
ncbi:MAG: HNH endonuclease, partial [Candidatus Latescibacteria bacterium]|nr:HNH endonuclease [Candidatus Latescibacterota bacterium]